MDTPGSVRLSSKLRAAHQNNFNFIRLLAALAVLVSHSFEFVPGAVDPVYRLTHLINCSYIGLCTFFFLSGILVTQSLRRSSTWKNFCWRRFLRLYPAACLVILSCALVIGPLVTTLPLPAYFTDPEFYRFLSGCLLLRIHFTLPGVWAHAPKGPALIGPLWSIVLELKLYACLLVYWAVKIPWKKTLALIGLLLAILFHLAFYKSTPGIFHRLIPVSFNPYSYTVLGALFVQGALCSIWQEKIVIRDYYIFLIIPLLLICAFFQLLTLITFVLIPACILYVATHGLRPIKRITPKADLSYGIYLWSGPIGKWVAMTTHPANEWLNFVISLAAVLPFAVFSWFLVERPFLALKSRVK